MREWRALHQGIIASDKLGKVGDAAFRLFMYLVVAQDDDGNYPWTPIKRKALVIGTIWDDAETVRFANELVTEGVCELSAGMISIVNGIEKQFNRKDVKTFRYNTVENVPSTFRARDVYDPCALTNSKEENSKEHDSREHDTASRADARSWLDRLAKHPTVATALSDQDWNQQFEGDFSDIDLPVEAAKFVDWWMEKQLKNWKVAWRNWCGRARKDLRNGQVGERTGIRIDNGPRHSVDDRLADY